MINVFTLTNINTEIIEAKLSKTYFRSMYQTSRPSHLSVHKKRLAVSKRLVTPAI